MLQMNRTRAQKLEASGKMIMVQCSPTTSSDVMFGVFFGHTPQSIYHLHSQPGIEPILPALEA